MDDGLFGQPVGTNALEVIGYRIQCSVCNYGLFSCGCLSSCNAEVEARREVGRRHKGPSTNWPGRYGRFCFVDWATLHSVGGPMLPFLGRLRVLEITGWEKVAVSYTDKHQRIYEIDKTKATDITERVRCDRKTTADTCNSAKTG